MRVIWCVRALCLAPVLLSVESPAPSMGLLGHFLELSRRGFDLPLGSPRHGRERCVSSTSATNLGHEHPHVVRLSSAHALPLHATACSDTRSERATPGSLAGAQPRVPVRLTPHRRLRHLPSTTARFEGELVRAWGLAFGEAERPRRFRPRAGLGASLWRLLSHRDRAARRASDAGARRRGPLPPRSRQ